MPDFQSGFAGIFMGRTVSELMELVLERLGETDYTRYPQTRVLNALNRMHQDFAEKTRILSGWALIPMRAGIPGYPLPKNCLPNGLERARFYSTNTTYEDLSLKDREWMDEHYPGWKTAGNGTPQILVSGDWFGNVMKVEVYPPPLTDGTLYTSGIDVGVVVGGTALPANTSDITGQATGGSTSTLQDSSVDFTTMGLAVGQAVIKTNATAGSEPVGYILTIAATQLTFSAVLTNTGTFAAGDSYQILFGEVGVITSITSEENYAFSADVGVIGKITPPANNVLVEYKRYAYLFDLDKITYQKPEIPWAWHEKLADGAAGDILSDDPNRKSGSEIKRSAELKLSLVSAAASCIAKPSAPMKRPAKFTVRLRRGGGRR
jgi:hypothetical protein